MTDTRGFILDSIFYRVPELSILQGVYLKIEPGIVGGLFGRNGSGKTTLLKIAAGQLQASSGLTIIDGERLRKRSRHRRFTKLAYLPQVSMLPPDMKVSRLLHTVPGHEALRKNDLLEKLVSNRVGELSGGERRYLEVAMVLSLERDYVLLDEPFTGVEPRLIDSISERIQSVAGQGSGVLVTDHYHQYMLPIVDEAYLMWQKQCYNLGSDIRAALERLGYLRTHPTPSSTA